MQLNALEEYKKSLSPNHDELYEKLTEIKDIMENPKQKTIGSKFPLLNKATNE